MYKMKKMAKMKLALYAGILPTRSGEHTVQASETHINVSERVTSFFFSVESFFFMNVV